MQVYYSAVQRRPSAVLSKTMLTWFADIFQYGVSLLILAILLFFGTTQLQREQQHESAKMAIPSYYRI